MSHGNLCFLHITLTFTAACGTPVQDQGSHTPLLWNPMLIHRFAGVSSPLMGNPTYEWNETSRLVAHYFSYILAHSSKKTALQSSDQDHNNLHCSVELPEGQNYFLHDTQQLKWPKQKHFFSFCLHNPPPLPLVCGKKQVAFLGARNSCGLVLAGRWPQTWPEGCCWYRSKLGSSALCCPWQERLCFLSFHLPPPEAQETRDTISWRKYSVP